MKTEAEIRELLRIFRAELPLVNHPEVEAGLFYAIAILEYILEDDSDSINRAAAFAVLLDKMRARHSFARN